jgi:hypothetical protein
MFTPFPLSVKFKPPISSLQLTTRGPDTLRKSTEFPKKSTSILPEGTSFSQGSKKAFNLTRKVGTLSYLNLFHIIWQKDLAKRKSKKSSSHSAAWAVLPFTLLINLLSTSSMTLIRLKLKC